MTKADRSLRRGRLYQWRFVALAMSTTSVPAQAFVGISSPDHRWVWIATATVTFAVGAFYQLLAAAPAQPRRRSRRSTTVVRSDGRTQALLSGLLVVGFVVAMTGVSNHFTDNPKTVVQSSALGGDTNISIGDVNASSSAQALPVEVKGETVQRTPLPAQRVGSPLPTTAPSAGTNNTAPGTTSTTQPSSTTPTALPRVGTVSLERYLASEHLTSTSSSSAPSGYQRENTLGVIYANSGAPGTFPLYECRHEDDHFTTAASDCEGYGSVVSTLGWAYASAQSSPETVPLVRCVYGSDHFDSLDPSCEGQQVDGVVAYVMSGR
jgi:eukaryotic-like serine/threonine-protein kinase